MKIISGCVIIDSTNRMMLLHKLKHDYYELPGGKVKTGESLKEAAMRETKEEIGCVVALERKWSTYEFMRGEEHIQSNIYIAKIIS